MLVAKHLVWPGGEAAVDNAPEDHDGADHHNQRQDDKGDNQPGPNFLVHTPYSPQAASEKAEKKMIAHKMKQNKKIKSGLSATKTARPGLRLCTVLTAK